MKPFLLFITLFIITSSIKAQTVIVSGECMTGTIALDPVDSVDGKIAYEGIGTINDTTTAQVAVFWIAADTVWVLAFDGQPYFQSSCDSALPVGTGSASCPWTHVVAQPCTGGTALFLRGAGTLLVNLISFTARTDNKQVIVNWKTANEINNRGFDIQRSPDGINWKNIGFVNGNTNSSVERSYQFSDLEPLRGKNFYRLQQVDVSGKYSYSKVASVNFQKPGFYTIAGNPGNGLYHINIEAASEKVELSVMDAGGKRVMTKTTGTGVQTINITNFPPGIYLLRIRKGTDLFNEKLVKF